MAAILDFRSARFYLFLIYNSPWWFLASLESTGLSVQEKKRKIDFQDGCHGGHLGFPIGTILAIFDLQVTLMVPSKFGVNWPFGSGEEAKNRFSRWQPWRPSWISDRNDFSYFWSTSHPDASYQVKSSQLAQGCRRSRLLKQLLTPHDARRTTDDGHWLTTIAHHEHFVLRWAKNKMFWFYYTRGICIKENQSSDTTGGSIISECRLGKWYWTGTLDCLI